MSTPAEAVARFSFTKLVVADLKRMATFYEAVYGLSEVWRYRAEVNGHPIEEIILGREDGSSGLILFTYLDSDGATNGEVLLGFTTDDVAALFERGVAAGGRIWAEIEDPGLAGVALVGFLADPEGHVAEVVQTETARH
ncbi:MAG TPA: VOC family protein [Acidimicrobiales bacterium]|nr:VOC family protein [Acidimicrobiales bacterium]